MKILIIEDELLILKTLETLATHTGHRVTSTPSGREAIEILRNNEFDLIICDLMLNDISGFDILEETKNLFGSDVVANKIIIITAYKSDDIINRVKGYGCRFFEKPFDNVKETLIQMTAAKSE